MTLAQQLVNREKTKTQLINDGFNRYSLNSKEGLPSWFLEDEAKYYKPNIPITKEAVRALKARQRELDARPIKKVAEAKARKKLKASQKLEKAMKKAEGVNQTSDMTEKEKAAQIEKLMRQGYGKGKKGKKEEVKLVVAKGSNRGIKGRPKGVKGRYRMVDSRGKKEVCLISPLPSCVYLCIGWTLGKLTRPPDFVLVARPKTPREGSQIETKMKIPDSYIILESKFNLMPNLNLHAKATKRRIAFFER